MRRRGLTVLVATLALAGGEIAHAHGGDARVHAVLGALPAELAGMRIEVHDTIAPQVVLENRTARTVEVLDEEGVAFLRIGPRGVEGNVAARAWYVTQGPGAPVAKAAHARGEPRWVRARVEPTFGWFDPRLAPNDGDDGDAGHDPQGAWSIPLRVDGAAVRLRGEHRRVEEPAGAWVARLTSSTEAAPGVRVRLLPGRHPGLLLENAGPLPVVVVDGDGRPLLRIATSGVEANLRSAAWRDSGRAGATRRVAPGDGDQPSWARVADAGRYGWIDPRLSAPSETRARTGRPLAWQVPLVIGEERVLMKGSLSWRARRAAASSPSSR